MPPIDNAPASVIRYLTRLLSAMCLQAGGELRIPQKYIRQVAEENSRQALMEDIDSKKEELVLRFGSKHSAVYPVEPEPCVSQKPQSVTQTQSSPNGRPDQPPASRPPLTEQQLLKIENAVKVKRAQAALKREQEQRSSSSQLDVNFPV